RGIEVFLVCDPSHAFQEELRAARVNILPATVRSRIDVSAIRQIRRTLSQERIDLLYATTNRGLAAGTLASLGLSIPRVAYRGTMGNLSAFLPQDFFTYFHPSLTKIVCNCHAVKSSLEKMGISSEKLHVI